jgi:nucleotide-binding universal stress UspA family protein
MERMLKTILVPLDGSDLAEWALRVVEHLAKAGSARLILTFVLPDSVLLEYPEEDVESEHDVRSYLDAIARRLKARGLEVETSTPIGDPASGILAQAESGHADVVVMATHGRSGLGRWLYGSVADEVLRRAPVPVILNQPGAERWPADRRPRVLVPLDGSHLAEAALGPAQELVALLGGELLLLQVVQFPPYSLYGDGSAYLAAFNPDVALNEAQQYLGAVASSLTVSGVRVLAELGLPALDIAEVARREKVHLIVMATHGRSGLARALLGSVATGTLQRSSVPLMLIRPSALKTDRAPAVFGADAIRRSVASELAVTVGLSAGDLDLLQRGLGELLSKRESDPQITADIKQLLRRLHGPDGRGDGKCKPSR